MNILFFSRLFYPHIGGVEKHLLEISRILIKKGHKISVVTEQDSSKTKLNEKIGEINLYRIPNLAVGKLKKFQIWIWLFKNLKLIKDADVIHCHDVFFWYLPFRFLFPFKKVYTTFHGYEGFPLKTKDILIHRISEKLSMGNICIGDFIKKWYGTKPTVVSYGGVNIPKIKNQKSIVGSKDSAVFVGRLDKQTGILTYVEVVKELKKQIPNFDFLVIGDGNLRPKIDGKVKILTQINNASEYFQKYNFAFVSRYLSILEAMAAKRLVFAVYDNPLKEDYLRLSPFAKFIIISNSVPELSSKISFYLDNLMEKEKMVEKAYGWVEKNTWEKMAATYVKLWSGSFDRETLI